MSALATNAVRAGRGGNAVRHGRGVKRSHHAIDEERERVPLAERKMRCRWCNAPLAPDTVSDIYCCPLAQESEECLWCGDDLPGPGKAFCKASCSSHYHDDVGTAGAERLVDRGRRATGTAFRGTLRTPRAQEGRAR